MGAFPLSHFHLYTGWGVADPKVPERYRPTDEESQFAHQQISQFPHCDSLILHRRGSCQYCDSHPDWQALRIAWEINFTGEADPQKAPCPSAKYRPAYQAHRWHGNRPSKGDGEYVDVPLQPPTAWEHLDREENDESV